KLGELVPSIRKTSELVQEVAATSREQANGVALLNRAVARVDEVARGNAAASHQMASVATELNGQAATLTDTIAYFRRTTAAPPPAPRRPRRPRGPRRRPRPPPRGPRGPPRPRPPPSPTVLPRRPATAMRATGASSRDRRRQDPVPGVPARRRRARDRRAAPP